MIEAIENMRTVYENETKALETMDTKGFMALQDDKLKVTDQYRYGIEEIMRRKDEIKEAEPELKQQLKAMQKDFVDLSAQNFSALKRMRRGVERLGDTIQRAAKESINKQNTFSYSQSGKIENNDRKSVSIGVIETA